MLEQPHAILEVPTPWMQSPRDGDRQRAMFSALESSVRSAGVAPALEEIEFGTTFVRRPSPDRGFRLSYHSCGDSRHVWRIKETPIPWFYSFDRLGFAGWSELWRRQEAIRPMVERIDQDEASDYCSKIASWLSGENLSKYFQGDSPPPEIDGFVLFPLQISGDIVARLSRVDQFQALLSAARYAARHRHPLVVKRHPYCTSRLIKYALRILPRVNPYVHVTNASVNALLDRCDAVLVSNSGVGLEALARNKTVFSFGRSEYEWATERLHGSSDIERAFTPNRARATGLGVKFVYFFLKYHCFDARDQRTIERCLTIADSAASSDTWCERNLFDENNATFWTAGH